MYLLQNYVLSSPSAAPDDISNSSPGLGYARLHLTFNCINNIPRLMAERLGFTYEGRLKLWSLVERGGGGYELPGLDLAQGRVGVDLGVCGLTYLDWKESKREALRQQLRGFGIST